MRSQGGKVMNVTKIFLNPDYQQSGFYNVIAVLKLKTRLKFNSKVASIALSPKGFEVADGTQLLVSGWGA